MGLSWKCLGRGGLALAVLLAGSAWGIARAEDPPPVPPPPPPPRAPGDPILETPPALEHVAAPADGAAPGDPKAAAPTSEPAPVAAAAAKPEDEATEEAAEEPAAEEKEEAAEEKAEEPKAPPPVNEGWARDFPPPPPPSWRGEVSVRARGRYGFGDDDHDLDLYEYVLAQFRDELAPGWSGSLNFRLAQDIDGQNDDDEFFVFDSIDDTYDSPITGRVYHVYANYRPGGGWLQEVRLGRQTVDAGDLLLMDGVRATSRPFGACPAITVEAFAGVPAHLFESGPEGDFMGGVGLLVQPGPFTEIQFDYAYLRDENDFYGSPDAHLLTLSVYQRVNRNLRLRGRWQQVNEDVRLLEGSFDAFSASGDASVRGVLKTQPSTIESLVYDLDPFFAIQQKITPYWEAALSGSKELSRHFILDGGGSARLIYDEADTGEYNREYGRLYATLSTWEWPTRSLALAVSGEWWTGGGNDTWAATFDLQWNPSDCWRFTAGTDYSLWRTDVYSDSERFDSWVYFARATWTPNDRWRFDLKLEIETDDYDTYADLNAVVRYQW